MKKSCEKSGGAMSHHSLLSACWMRKRMRVAVRRDMGRRSCVAVGSQSGDAGELAALLPASADGQTGPMRAEGRCWKNSAPQSPRQSPPLSERREEEMREGLEDFSGITLFSDPCGNSICSVKAWRHFRGALTPKTKV